MSAALAVVDRGPSHVMAMAVDGQIVMVDTDRYRGLDGKTPAVVARFDGSIGIERPRSSEKAFFAGVRGGFYQPSPGGIEVYSCTIIGAVIPR